MQNLGHTANVLPNSYDKETATMRKAITLTITRRRPGKPIVLRFLGYGMLKEASRRLCVLLLSPKRVSRKGIPASIRGAGLTRTPLKNFLTHPS